MSLSALHEAGHAIVGNALGIEIRRVTLHDEEGHPATRHGPIPGDCSVEAHRRCCVMLVGGFFAERLFEGDWRPDEALVVTFHDVRGNDYHESSIDLREAYRLIEQEGFSVVEIVTACRRILREYWREVEQLAAALDAKGTLEGGGLRSLLATSSRPLCSCAN